MGSRGTPRHTVTQKVLPCGHRPAHTAGYLCTSSPPSGRPGRWAPWIVTLPWSRWNMEPGPGGLDEGRLLMFQGPRRPGGSSDAGRLQTFRRASIRKCSLRQGFGLSQAGRPFSGGLKTRHGALLAWSRRGREEEVREASAPGLVGAGRAPGALPTPRRR